MDLLLQVTEYQDLEVLWGGACCITLAVLFFAWLYVCVWVYRDAEKRGSSGFLWAVLVFIFGIIPLIIWLVVRPPVRRPVQYGQMPQPPAPAAPPCPSCGGMMAYVPQYGMWYCYACQKYQQPGGRVVVTREVVKVPCPYCGVLNENTRARCSACGAGLFGR